MSDSRTPHNPERKGPGPGLLIFLLALIMALVVSFIILHPRPPAAIDGTSPTTQH